MPKNNHTIFALILIITIISGSMLSAQVEPSAVDTSDSTIRHFMPIDSLVSAQDAEDSANKSETSSVMKKSPVKALYYSIVPGMGQIYVESYWKAPVFMGAAGFLVYNIVRYNNLFEDTKSTILEAQASGAEESYILNLKVTREFQRDNRDQSAFWLMAVYAISAIDAYVGAHLYDFNVDDKFSFNYYPDQTRGTVVSLSFDF